MPLGAFPRKLPCRLTLIIEFANPFLVVQRVISGVKESAERVEAGNLLYERRENYGSAVVELMLLLRGVFRAHVGVHHSPTFLSRDPLETGERQSLELGQACEEICHSLQSVNIHVVPIFSLLSYRRPVPPQTSLDAQVLNILYVGHQVWLVSARIFKERRGYGLPLISEYVQENSSG